MAENDVRWICMFRFNILFVLLSVLSMQDIILAGNYSHRTILHIIQWIRILIVAMEYEPTSVGERKKGEIDRE